MFFLKVCCILLYYSCFFIYLLVLVTVSEVVTYQVAFTLRLRLPLVQGTYICAAGRY